jgi:diguanylate cyclase (GGDEF)-like protein
MRSVVSRVALSFAIGTLALYAAYTCLGLGKPELASFFDTGVHSVLMFGAAIAVWVRVARRREDRLAWGVIAGGLTSYAVGDLIYYVFFANMESPPYPSIADALWLGFYPASYVGLVLLVRSRVHEFRASLWLDVIIAALTAAAVSAIVILGSISSLTGGSLAVVATNMAYPVGDIVLFGFILGVFALTGWRPGRAWSFLGAGLAINGVVDGIYLYEISAGKYTPGEAMDVLWPLAMATVAFAAWQPRSPDRGQLQVGRGRTIAVPIFFMSAAIAIETYDHFARVPTVGVILTSLALLAAAARLAMTTRENLKLLDTSRGEALTDALTGLGNRRPLIADLERVLAQPPAQGSAMLVLFDLNGFKSYNDSFGHPAGDALLARLGHSFAAAVGDRGGAYRLGGDEFCALLSAPYGEDATLAGELTHSLAEAGDGFSITAAHGTATLPRDAADASEAMRVADQRMYANKAGGRGSARRQSGDVLLRTLHERDPLLGDHLQGVAELAEQTAIALGIDTIEVEQVRLAAELHDVGKMAIPDALLNKPGALDADEWKFIRGHTLIGERILASAPALGGVARLVRSSHERWDGAGYPDELAGADIPQGSRIVAVCDAFDAMTSDRPYRARRGIPEVLAELARCAGTQFDPEVVAAFVKLIERRRSLPGLPVDESATHA